MMWKKPESDYPPPEPTVSPARSNPVEVRRQGATIGPSISIKGDLTGEEDLWIQGHVEGKIDLKQNNITVGKGGHIKADIYGRVISIEGEVEGNLYGEEQIVIRQSGTVRGNIIAPRVSLEDGSKFKGSIDMEPKSSERQRSLNPVATESRAREDTQQKGVTNSDRTPKAGVSGTS